MLALLGFPRTKLKFQAIEVEPLKGVDDQKLSIGVSGKAAGSIAAAVAGCE